MWTVAPVGSFDVVRQVAAALAESGIAQTAVELREAMLRTKVHREKIPSLCLSRVVEVAYALAILDETFQQEHFPDEAEMLPRLAADLEVRAGQVP